MPQKNSQQTRIDQFYKVVSKRNTGCGIKLVNQKFHHQIDSYSRGSNILLKQKKSLPTMSTVESEVEIIEEKKPHENLIQNATQKRPLSLALEESPKKYKLDTNINVCNNNQTSLKVISSNEHCNNAYSQKKTPQRNLISSPKSDKFSPSKLCLNDRINIGTVKQAIKNFNLVRQDIISINEFNLESIYQDQEFKFSYSDNITPNQEKFDMKDIIFPQEKHADHLLMVVMDVFSNPINCGYFLKNELDQIFLLCTLSPESQILFIRLLKRKLGWHRISNIKYLDIANNLNPFLKELIQNKFCTSDLDSTDTLILLNMLQADEVKNICRKLKIDHKGNKTLLIHRLLKYENTSKSLFTGAKLPKYVLRTTIFQILQQCIRLPENIISLYDRVLTLSHPSQDPKETVADFFQILTNVHKGELQYPPWVKKEFFPIFKNKLHVIEFIKSKTALKDVLIRIEKKEWIDVRSIGRIALAELSKGEINEKESSLPLHIKKFKPEYLWVKVLSKSVDAFKKTPETIPEAVEILKTLINQKHLIQTSQGKWYNELALIQMHHCKDLETSATLTIHALEQDRLTEVDVSNLSERLRKLMRRKTGISKKTKDLIQKAQKKIESKGLYYYSTNTKTISANIVDRFGNGGKSTWFIRVNDNNKYYGSVEMLALQHYTNTEDFHEGLHCEGLLPVTLFTVFFWDELYNTFIPGVFVSSYQTAPLDLFTVDFFNNRKKLIEEKIKFAQKLDLESFVKWMNDRFSNYNQYKSLISCTLFTCAKHFKEIIICLGIHGVIGICERLISNFRLWRSGFPDLILWNVLISKCKIVEVKGPGDSLSEKQKLWLQYLESLGIEVEICYVKELHGSLKWNLKNILSIFIQKK